MSLSVTFKLNNTNTSHTDASFHTTPSCTYAHITTVWSKHYKHLTPTPPEFCSKGATNNEKELWFIVMSPETFISVTTISSHIPWTRKAFDLCHAHSGKTLSPRPTDLRTLCHLEQQECTEECSGMGTRMANTAHESNLVPSLFYK